MPQTKTISSSDQRENKRFTVHENTYALLKQPQYTELGKIIDISRTGISFLCINEGDWSENPFEIDILLDNTSPNSQHDDAMLKDIPLQPILYSRNSLSVQDPSESMMKRCGVKFGELNREQQELINILIMRHTKGHS